ncbi:hypothetical protein, unlikely [Trypanosoma brucei gambiense DAL972]|uniref:Uncharacterized protein n=1 Tax=Trypanosoma brucei gambiense (strain MHOM/CI/86/DAL972) TaxID=679716 RepID=C9ZZJ3_TRYB9|nr:hypothetical protein, unlikely [Trypanosoma brucei gambiense DAL972]CBH14842.1 hypothetical protein, unlikely [Trypanosoma brucei gambiense DAL972]|eukprot:XP_011777108.1 hypothetical protein, unlikely [Trypanosoma brucei gambiense DAL972]
MEFNHVPQEKTTGPLCEALASVIVIPCAHVWARVTIAQVEYLSVASRYRRRTACNYAGGSAFIHSLWNTDRGADLGATVCAKDADTDIHQIYDPTHVPRMMDQEISIVRKIWGRYDNMQK